MNRCEKKLVVTGHSSQDSIFVFCLDCFAVKHSVVTDHGCVSLLGLGSLFAFLFLYKSKGNVLCVSVHLSSPP